MKSILIIDDDKDLRFLLKKNLTQSGFNCYEAKDGDNGLRILETNIIDLVLCDFKLRHESGSDILVRIKEINPSLPVVMITGYSNVKSAVEVMQLGAMDYLEKPLVPSEIVTIINRILDEAKFADAVDNSASGKKVSVKRIDESYVLSPNDFFQSVLKQIDLVAPTDYSVIIYGESGSGKEAFAQEIHKRSKRKDKQFLAIDCGALSKELSGSTLFGHEKGSFTGAMEQKIGAFEIARGGTVFLDEVTNLPYETQVSLLRTMQERKIRRIGGTKDIDIDIRVIVASNKKLLTAAKEGVFREDLYHRFNEFTIDVLPLRERKDDIIFYADHFLTLTNQELGKSVEGFTDDARKALLDHPWPGNLRELKNMVKRCVLITETSTIGMDVLPFELSKQGPAAYDERDAFEKFSFKDEGTEDYERIIYTLKKTGFDKKKTGSILNMNLKTLNNKIKEFANLKDLSFNLFKKQ